MGVERRFVGIVFFLFLFVPLISAEVFISEIMYDPADSISLPDANLEWVEIYNTELSALNLSDFSLNGKSNSIAPIIGRDEYLVLVRDSLGFESFYGNNDTVWNDSDGLFNISSWDFGSGLSNSGASINFSNGSLGEILTYGSGSLANGAGNSLERYNFITQSLGDSLDFNGTPGVNNSIYDDMSPNVYALSTFTVELGQLAVIRANATDNGFLDRVLINVSGQITEMQLEQAFTILDGVYNYTQNATVLSNFTLQFIANDTGELFNDTTTSELIVEDTTAPVFTTFPSNMTLEFGNSYSDDVEASDLQTVSYGVNDSSFSINASGYLMNNTSLSLGQYNLNVSVTDLSGNKNEAYATIVVQDTTAPIYSIAPSNQTLEFGSSFLLDVEASDLQTVSYSINDTVNFAINGSGAITNIVTLSLRTYNLNVSASDPSGNHLDTEFSIVVQDTITPSLALSYPTNGAFLNSNFFINGTADDLTTLSTSINDSLLNSGNNTHFQFIVGSIIDGLYNFNISTTDEGGNSNSSTVSFTIDTSPPLVTILSPINGSFVAGDITINVSASDATTTVTELGFSLGSIDGALTLSNGFYTTTVNSSLLADGGYNLTILANDTLMNTNSTEFVEITIDNTPPTFSTLTTNALNQTSRNHTVVIISASVNDINPLNVSVNGVEMNSGFSLSSSLDALGCVPSGNCTLTFIATDKALNQNTGTAIVLVDTQAPVLSLLTREPSIVVNTENVTLNVTVTDVLNDVGVVLLEENSTGIFINNSMIRIEADIFSLTLLSTILQNQEQVFTMIHAADILGNSLSSADLSFMVTNRPPVLNQSVTLENLTFEEDIIPSFSWNLLSSFSDPDADSLVYSTNVSTGLQFSIDNVTGSATVKSDKDFNGEVDFVFIASDPYGATVESLPVRVTVNARNDPPQKLSDLPEITFIEDQSSAIFNLSLFFIDDEPMRFGVNLVGNDNLTPQVDSVTGLFFLNTTENFNGITFVQFFAEDTLTPPERTVSNSILVNITPVNDAPTVNPQIVNATLFFVEDGPSQTISLTDFASDVDDMNATLSWSIVSFNQSILSAQTVNSILTILALPDSFGVDDVVLNLSDAAGASVLGTLIVNISSVNDIPVFTSVPTPQQTNDALNNSLVIDLSPLVNDFKDNNTLLTITGSNFNASLYTVVQQVGMSLFLKTTPNIAKKSTLTDIVTINVADPEGGSAAENVTITIVPFNDPPSNVVLLTPPQGGVVTNPLKKVLLNWTESFDDDGDALTYSVFLGTNGTTFLASSSVQGIEATNLIDNTTYLWEVVVSDGALNSSSSGEFTFFTQFNNIPQIVNATPSSPLVQIANSSQEYSVYVKDIDVESVTVNFSNLDFSQVVSVGGEGYAIVNFTPSSVGQTTLLVTVSDPQQNSVSTSFDINVSRSNVAPVLAPLASLNSLEDVLLTFVVEANDGDFGEGDTLQFSTNDSRFSVSPLNQTHARLSFTPTNADVGDYSLNVTVNDNLLEHASQIVFIQVQNTNDNPRANNIAPSNESRVILGTTQTIVFSIDVTDDDTSDVIGIEWFVNNSLNTNSTNLSFISTNFGQGVIPVKAIFTDGKTNHTVEWTVDISELPVSSLFSLTLNGTVDAATFVTLSNSQGTIDFGNATLDLRNAIDLDKGVILSNNLVAIDSSLFPVFSIPSVVTLRGVTLSNPIILKSPLFTSTKSAITNICTDCSIVSNSNGVIQFSTLSFSSFTAVESSSLFRLSVPSTITLPTNGTSLTVYSISNTGQQTVSGISATAASTFDVTLSLDNVTFTSQTPSFTLLPGEAITLTLRSNLDEINTTASVGTVTIRSNEAPGISTSLVAVVNTKLRFKEVEFDHGGDDEIVVDGDIVDNVKPGEEAKIKITLENLFSSDITIKDIDVEMTVKELDDSDDIEDDDTIDSLDASEDDDVKFEFTIPEEADEDKYEVFLEALGKDDKGNGHTATLKFFIDVEKEKHDLRITKASVSPQQIACSRDVEVLATVKNFGSEDEDETVIELTSPALSLNWREENLDLENDAYDDDSEYSLRKKWTIPSLDAGTYTIDITVYRDQTRQEEKKSIPLIVDVCADGGKNETLVVVGTPTVRGAPKKTVVKKAQDDIPFTLISLLVVIAGLLIFICGILYYGYKNSRRYY